jgi:hypothetical protein
MAGYIGTTPVPQATQHRESFTATGGQTSFATAGYTPQFIDVYLNGVKLAPADFTATNGSDVVLASGATASDILEIVAYTPFEVANQTFTGTTTAANLTVTGAFTSQGIDDNADAVAITIDSSENVGIGTSTPRTGLHLYGAGQTNSAISDAGSLGAFLRVSDTGAAGGAGGGVIFGTNASEADGFAGFAAIKGLLSNGNDRTIGALAFSTRASTTDTALTERMRLTSDGNLLVGTTTTDTATVTGVTFQPDGQIFAGASNQQVATFSRQDSDGEIVRLRKGSTTVGSIGVNSGTRIYIGSGDANLTFNPAGNYVFPSTSTGGARDAQLDLGLSAARFKDLYLSGGVYLGGTGSANLLDDVEEGIWTPTWSSTFTQGCFDTATGFSVATGKYIKVGSFVWCYAELKVVGGTGDIGSQANYSINYSSLPFTPASHGNSFYTLHGNAMAYASVGAGEIASASVTALNSQSVLVVTYNGIAGTPASNTAQSLLLEYRTTA